MNKWMRVISDECSFCGIAWQFFPRDDKTFSDGIIRQLLKTPTYLVNLCGFCSPVCQC